MKSALNSNRRIHQASKSQGVGGAEDPQHWEGRTRAGKEGVWQQAEVSLGEDAMQQAGKGEEDGGSGQDEEGDEEKYRA